MIDKITNVFISDGTDLKSNGTAFTTITDLGIVSGQMVNVAGSTTIAANPTLYFVNKTAEGYFKKSVPVLGTHVTSYKGDNYAPAQRCVWSIGYNRQASAGSIEVNNATAYSFDLHFVNDKTFYSERPEYLRIDFTSSATATQLSIATQIAGKINSSAFAASPEGMKEIQAVVVTDDSVNYGVEIWGLDINQFRTTTYTVEKVNFSVQCDSSTGFGATTVGNIQLASLGTGTYENVYVAEKVGKRNEGVLNWTYFPVPEQTYLSKAAGFLSGSLSGITCSGAIGTDELTITTASGLVTGSKIVVSGYTYEIKYWKTGDTIAVLTTPLLTGPSTTAIATIVWYSLITIEVQDVTSQDGSGVMQLSKKIITLALPAINAGAPSISASTIITSVEAVLNPWMTSAPLNPATLSLV